MKSWVRRNMWWLIQAGVCLACAGVIAWAASLPQDPKAKPEQRERTVFRLGHETCVSFRDGPLLCVHCGGTSFATGPLSCVRVDP